METRERLLGLWSGGFDQLSAAAAEGRRQCATLGRSAGPQRGVNCLCLYTSSSSLIFDKRCNLISPEAPNVNHMLQAKATKATKLI